MTVFKTSNSGRIQMHIQWRWYPDTTGQRIPIPILAVTWHTSVHTELFYSAPHSLNAMGIKLHYRCRCPTMAESMAALQLLLRFINEPALIVCQSMTEMCTQSSLNAEIEVL